MPVPHIDPDSVPFHLTGFKVGSMNGALGGALASSIMASLMKIMAKYSNSINGANKLAQKLAVLNQKIDALVKMIQGLSVPMNKAQITKWIANFKTACADAKAAIEAMGQGGYIKEMMSALEKTEGLVTNYNLLKLVQQTAKNLKTLYEDYNAAVIEGDMGAVNPKDFLNAATGLTADVEDLQDTGAQYAASGIPELVALGKAMENLSKTVGYMVKDMFEYQRWTKSISYFIERWEQPSKYPKKEVEEEVMQEYLIPLHSNYQHGNDRWKKSTRKFIGKFLTDYQRAIDITKTYHPSLTNELTLLNRLLSSPNPNWQTQENLYARYQAAVAGYQEMMDSGAQLSRQSVTTLNSLMTGMTAIIKQFAQLMAQPIRDADFALGQMRKR